MPSRLACVSAFVLIAAAVALGVGLWISSETNGIGKASRFSQSELSTSSPTVSFMPSPSPSFSPAPTLRPSSSPTNIPSASPSSEPSSMPSSSPTKSPTKAPTISPAPTMSPSSSPSAAPSAPPIPGNYRFRMKLYWKQGYTWQEETFEREWCLECTKCSPLTTSGNAEGCSRKTGCDRGDQLWLQRCKKNDNNVVFQIMDRDKKKGDLFQIVNTNLCVERVSSRQIALEQCNRNEVRQRWINFRPRETPFAWTPVEYGVTPRCVTQHHHPKAREVIYVEACKLAHQYATGFWEAY